MNGVSTRRDGLQRAAGGGSAVAQRRGNGPGRR